MNKNKYVTIALPLTAALSVILFSDVAAAAGFDTLNEMADGFIAFIKAKTRPIIAGLIAGAGGVATWKTANPGPLVWCTIAAVMYNYVAQVVVA